MQMFRRLFIAAASAGLLSGLFVMLIHQVTTVPIILEAEVFENAADEAAPAAAPAAATAEGHDHAADGHSHGDDEWAPQDGFERTAYTALADLLTGIGFALLLIAGFAVSGRAIDWRQGLYWGLAGYVAFILAPAIGLPPEVPGTVAADLTARQIWWLATVLLTAGGLGLLFYLREPKPLWAAVGLALIVVPHAIGAPQPEEHSVAAPESLVHRFIVATLMSSLLFWAVLGALSGIFYKRFVQQPA